MNTTTRTISIIAIVIILIVFGIFFIRMPGQKATTSLPATASYACDANKSITASYYAGDVKPATTDQPPVPTGKVVLTLSDGRVMTLPQTISADGARYANTDESVVFWSKGNGLTFTESKKQTYVNCVQIASDPGGLPQVYGSSVKGFSLRYPSGFTVNDAYSYQELGPGKNIAGVKFTIPSSTATGTNLGGDSYISVERIPQAQTCSANLFIDPAMGVNLHTVVDGDVTYSVASTTGAGAGNRYEETIYAIPGSNPCVAVRYFVHYSVFENYPAGTVTEFNKISLLNQFDTIRRTLVIAH